MKKIIFVVAAVMLLLVTPAATQNYEHGKSVLNEGISVYGIPSEMRYIPFKDSSSGMYGFLRNISNLGVKIPPMYEDVCITAYMLVPVKKDGRWGVIDIGARYIDYSSCNPIIPCSYSQITIKTNNIAICDGKEIDISKQGYEKWQ